MVYMLCESYITTMAFLGPAWDAGLSKQKANVHDAGGASPKPSLHDIRETIDCAD